MLTLQLLEPVFSIHRCPPSASIPAEVFDLDFYFIAKTNEELSLVVPNSVTIASQKVETPWSALKVKGPLDFSLTGILAKISAVLAEKSISIFAISSFDTDYILVKNENTERAIEALITNGYNIER